MIKKMIWILGIFPQILLAQESFTITGKIGELDAPAQVHLVYFMNQQRIIDSLELKDGQFTFEGIIKDPQKASLYLYHEASRSKETTELLSFYLEPVTIQINAPDSLKNAVISGSPLNDDYAEYEAHVGPVRDSIQMIYRMNDKIDRTKLDSAEIQKISSTFTYLRSELFIRNHCQPGKL